MGEADNTQQHLLLWTQDFGDAAYAFSADLKLSREHPAGVDVAGVGLNGLVVAKDLGSGSCGHGGQEQTVPHTVPEENTGTRKELNQG